MAVAVKAAPNRSAFIEKLGPDEEEVMKKIKALLPLVHDILEANKAMLVAKGIEK